MKRKLIIEEWLSLDGYVAAKDGSLDFFTQQVRHSYSRRAGFIQSIDTILLGRKTYELFSALWPGRPVENDPLAEKINTLEKIIFSGSLKTAPWGKWPEATLEAGNPATKIRSLQSLGGGNMVVWGSISLAQTLMRENLVDEYHLHLCPNLTGGGRKFFTEELAPHRLSLLETTSYADGVVLLRYSNLSDKT